MTNTFACQARSAFSFLEELGFRVVDVSQICLRYEGAGAFVLISWDPRSWELNVSLGLLPLKGQVEKRFSFFGLLLMLDEQDSKRARPPEVAESGLRPFLERLAEDVRTYAQPALRGDRMFFRRLDVFRSAQATQYMRDMEMTRVRSETEGAWKKRNYDQVVRLYGPVEEFLTESEKAKLSYARKHQHG
jgi:hypothetical protein